MAAQKSAGGRRVIEPGSVRAPEFPRGLDWLNVEAPPTMARLRGKIVLLDFWTHCCINCLHALEELKRLEAKYAPDLVVVGVHSGKFPAEKRSGSIREAVLRLGVEHPVVNDSEMEIWQQYSVRAWPTFMLIDPLGKVFGAHSGERLFEVFDRVLPQMIEAFAATGQLRREAAEPRLEPARAHSTLLSYPGKVLADEEGGRLFIADTGHHRIVVADLADGGVAGVIGSGERGFRDGPPARARFSQPQGMALHGGSLFVADAGNHAVRRVDFPGGTVSTLVGDGTQDVEWSSDPRPLDGARLNSPWDLQWSHGVLFVAMAGNHQIFGIDPVGGFMAGHAGSGREDHVDGPLLAAALAQPSGLATDGQSLFVADSEVSSIRAVDLDPRGGHVRTVVGKGLFDFGDRDGAAGAVRLQHPMGVACSGGRLYVADTYNNKVKVISLAELTARTLAGAGPRGMRDGPGAQARFDEPAGLSLAGGRLYVADTNNHAVRIVDLSSGTVSTWALRKTGRLVPRAAQLETLPEQAARPGRVRLSCECLLPPGCSFADHVSSGVTIRAGDRVWPLELVHGAASVAIDVAADEMLHAEAVVYYCCASRPGTCLFSRQVKILPVRADSAGDESIGIEFEVRARWPGPASPQPSP